MRHPELVEGSLAMTRVGWGIKPIICTIFMTSGIHISVKAEPIFEMAGFPVTNSLIFSWIAMLLFLLVCVYYAKSIKNREKSGLFYVLNLFFTYIYNLIESVLHDKVTFFYPLLGAYFFYILFNNWLGIMPTVGSVLVKPYVVHNEQVPSASEESKESIQQNAHEGEIKINDTLKDKDESHKVNKIPLFRSNNADLNATVALALITVFFVQFYGFKYNGLGYLKKFFNFSSPIMAFVGILELISEFARILSFAFRLFGNVLAGEILITIVSAIIPPMTSFILMPFFTLEIMAGAIQALVFTMISTVLIGMATQKAHH